ncbi:hypothetical protein [Paraflavitalea speifideaquila]|uniref:hypothetical protein n=1 Tax=Paraflavitalea speifideaquila TaxID=3076558 RepID=UPI0028E905AF|nr:hypothetical protein [Paraflavitalea speifideiaquila]
MSRGRNISGQLGSSTNYTIDGMNAKNPTSAGATTSRSCAPYSISIEAVREYGVNTAGVVTPSGDPYQIQIGFRYSF